MEEVTSNFATEEIFPTTHDDYDVENFTYLTQDFFLNSLSFSTNGPVDDDRYENKGPTKLNMILGIAMVFLIIPTVTGNGLILIAFWKSRRLRTYFNYFICSMAFADLSVGAINMPVYSIQFFSGRWPFGPRACLIFSIIDHIFVHVSVLSVVVIAIDRYKSLADPLLHLRRKSLGRAITVICPTYLIPIVMWTWFVLFRKQGRNENCYTGKRGEFPFNFVTPFFLFLIPLTILASVCIAIYRIIWSRNANRMRSVSGRSQSKRSTADISSSVAIDDSVKRGTLNPACSTEDSDPSQNGCHPDYKLDLTDALKTGNITLGPTENMDSTDRASPDVTHKETAFQGASLSPSDATHEKEPVKDDQAARRDNDTAAGVPKSVSGDGNARNKMGLKEQSGTRAGFTEDSSLSKQSEENAKAVRTLTFIVLALVVSWSPWVVFVFIENICGRNCNVESVYHVSMSSE